ncbi:19297_t:CDS:2, partial [Gigaspora margarita]
MTIPETFNHLALKPHSIIEQAICDHAVTKLIIAQNLPLSFTVPTKEKIKNLIDNGFKHICNALRNDLNQTKTVLLTADMWTVHSHDGYLCITVTWINENFELNEAVLAFIHLRYPHTANVITKSINNILEFWGLKDKVFSITTDSGANMKLACNKLEILSSSLTVQPEADAVADGKRLKEIIITESEWTEVVNIIKILKPFDNMTNYISGSSYPTMSIIYPTMISLRNVLLKQFEDENISNMTDFLDIFNIEEVSDKDEELEQADELADITNLTELIKKTIANPRCKNIKLEDTALDIQDYLRCGFDQETSNDTCKPSSDSIILNMSESFILSVFVAALPRIDYKAALPSVANMAHMYLAVPATSLPCKRTFSSCGNIMTKKRVHLATQMF